MTLRTLADEFRISPQAIRQWFGGTEQMWDQIARRFGSRWVASLTDLWRTDQARGVIELPGLPQLLPLDADDIAATRAWLAMTQLGRDNDAIGASLAPSEVREVEVIAGVANRSQLDLDAMDLDVLVAVVRGLRHAVCASERPMSLARAHAVLNRFVDVVPTSPSARAPGDQPLF